MTILTTIYYVVIRCSLPVVSDLQSDTAYYKGF